MINDCNCWFYDGEISIVWPHVGENKLSVGELWIKILSYYGERFDWAKGIVSIRKVKSLIKVDRNWKSYTACIEDPFDVHNISGHISLPMLENIREIFRKAWKLMAHRFPGLPMSYANLFPDCTPTSDTM